MDGSCSLCCRMTINKTRKVVLTSVALFLGFDPRPHRFCSIIQRVTDMLSDLIYKLLSQRYYIKNIGISPSGGLFSQTHSLSFMKAQVFNIKHDPTLICAITHNDNSHGTYKEMKFA